MEEQLPHAAGSETSKEAAASMVQAAPAIRQKVLNYVQQCGATGATCDEVEEALGLSHQTASARITELRHKFKKIMPAGFKRETRSGRMANCYVAV
jgi:hypothetical protein